MANFPDRGERLGFDSYTIYDSLTQIKHEFSEMGELELMRITISTEKNVLSP